MRWLATLLVGVVVGALGFATLRPGAGDNGDFDADAVWELGDEDIDKLFDCAGGADQAETRCARDVMEEAGASEDAQTFFQRTHSFLQGFRESGTVDLGEVVIPWRANAIDDYMLLNGSPDVVSVEREATPVAVFGQDPAYEPLRQAVNRSDDISESDDLVLWESDELFEDVEREGRKIRFIFQWSLKDACHACSTGYVARVGLEFAPDGTYLSAVPMNICWDGDTDDVERVEDVAPACPTPARSASRSRL